MFRGWADLVAESLATTDPDFGYANLAIRGRLFDNVVDEQVPADSADAAGPDQLRGRRQRRAAPRASSRRPMLARFEQVIATLRASGADVILFRFADVTRPAARPAHDLAASASCSTTVVGEVATSTARPGRPLDRRRVPESGAVEHRPPAHERTRPPAGRRARADRARADAGRRPGSTAPPALALSCPGRRPGPPTSGGPGSIWRRGSSGGSPVRSSGDHVLAKRPAAGARSDSRAAEARGVALPVCPFPPISAPEFEGYAHPDRLVTTDWLAKQIEAGTPGLVIVESDEDVLLYDTGHIPGAIKVDWHTELNDQVTRDYLDGAAFAEMCAAKGIGRDDTIVFYGDNFNWWAAYALWVFSLFGHQDVRLLNGGRAKWVAEDRPMTRDKVERPRADYPVVERNDARDPRLPRPGARPHRRRPAAGRRAIAGGIHRRAAAHAGLPAGGRAARRSHPGRAEQAVEAGGQRRRHLQGRRSNSRLYIRTSSALTRPTT